MISLYLLEDHELYLEGLMLLLKKNKNISIIGYQTSASIFLEQLPNIEADILLLDVHLPGVEAEFVLESIRKHHPKQKVIYLTMMRGSRVVHKLEKLGFQGYLLKNATITELINAIEIVAKGGQYFSAELERSNDNLQDYRNTITVNSPKEILSDREIEILKLVCMEYSNAQIAEKLFLSVGTVDTHRKNIIQKLGVSNTVGLVKFALTNKMIE